MRLSKLESNYLMKLTEFNTKILIPILNHISGIKFYL